MSGVKRRKNPKNNVFWATLAIIDHLHNLWVVQ